MLLAGARSLVDLSVLKHYLEGDECLERDQEKEMRVHP